MSNSVVPAVAAVQAKQLVRNKKLIQRKGKQEAAQDEQEVADHKSEEAQAVQAKESGNLHSSMSEAVSGDISFASALSEAAAGSAALTSEAAQDEGGYGSNDDGVGIDGTLLAVGALALAGAGAAIALGGGGKKNEAPTVSAATQTLTVLEDAAATNVTVTATDPDSDQLSYTVTTNPTKGTVTGGANGAFQYKPNADANGADSFVVTVTDPDGLSVTQTVNVTITPVNDAPTITADGTTASITTVEDVAFTAGKIVAADKEGDALTYSVLDAAKPAKGDVTFGANGTFTYTPKLDANGTDTFTVKVDDGKGGSVNQVVNVTITPVNDAPRPDADNQTAVTTAEDTAKEIVVSYTDPEGNPMSAEVVTGPAHGTFNTNTSVYTPALNYSGTDSITIKVTDSLGASTTSTINITVTPVNDAPTFAADTVAIAVNEDAAFSGSLAGAATDVEGDSLTYGLATQAAHGVAVVNANGTYTYTPNANYSGSDSYVVNVNDGNGGNDTMVVNVTVNPMPELVSIDVGNPAQDPVTINAAGDDFTFTENPAVQTHVVILNFAEGDSISGTNSAGYAFGVSLNDPKDLEITNGNEGANNIILLDDVLGAGFVSDYQSAVAAVGFDFMTFG